MRGSGYDGNSPSPVPVKGFFTPPATRYSSPPRKWNSEHIIKKNYDLFHVIHKVPAGDSPYVKAKHVQLIDKDPSRAVSLFWSAINAGDRVDSALKDMAVVMKQLDRTDEAIEAIRSFRHLCSDESQESLDNVLVELYKRSCRLDEQIHILQDKLKRIEDGNAFGGRRVKLARSQGKKIHITVEQEYARLLGNLAWAYLQQNDYKAAEEHYRKALSIEFDRNKQCNLAISLLYLNKVTEAKFLLQTIRSSVPRGQMDESYAKSFERASQLLAEIEPQSSSSEHEKENRCESGNFVAYKKPYETSRSNNTTYTPPIPAKCAYFRTPFTQPRRDTTMDLDGKSWRKEASTNEPVKPLLHRKLQFDNCKDSSFLPSRKCVENPQIEDMPTRRQRCSSTDENVRNEDNDDDKDEYEDVPVYNGNKKSWADMAEEDEQEENMKDLLGNAFWKSIF